MTLRIRRADAGDLAVLARFALALAHVHVALDPRRFIVPPGGLDAFTEFFRGELDRRETAVLIAEDEAAAVGYAFLRMEPPSIEALSAASAWLHDVYVDPSRRGTGVGRALVVAAMDAARQFGSPCLMLGVAPANTDGRRLFERLGLRPTMTEMRLDFE